MFIYLVCAPIAACTADARCSPKSTRESVLFPALSPLEKLFDQSGSSGGEAGANDDRDDDLEELLVARQGDAQVARLADVIVDEGLRTTRARVGYALGARACASEEAPTSKKKKKHVIGKMISWFAMGERAGSWRAAGWTRSGRGSG